MPSGGWRSSLHLHGTTSRPIFMASCMVPLLPCTPSTRSLTSDRAKLQAPHARRAPRRTPQPAHSAGLHGAVAADLDAQLAGAHPGPQFRVPSTLTRLWSGIHLPDRAPHSAARPSISRLTRSCCMLGNHPHGPTRLPVQDPSVCKAADNLPCKLSAASHPVLHHGSPG